MKTTPDNIRTLTENQIFVFGSNLSGVHAGGAARLAHDRFGAVWGKGLGHYGDSYALPTMDENLQPLPLERIAEFVGEFLRFAAARQDLEFLVTAVGCGIARFTADEIAPLFAGAADLSNVSLPALFQVER
jgi:hypothetical protein